MTISRNINRSQIAYLEHSEEGLKEGIKVASRLELGVVKVKVASKDLHSQESKDEDEEKEKQ